METVLITGGTGTIGKTLCPMLLQKGYRVIVLTRQPPARQPATEGLSYASWEINRQSIDGNAISQASYIIHLAGAGVAEKRWTDGRKKLIRESRTNSSALLLKGLKENNNRVKAVVSASAIGWYGPDPQVPNPHPFTETAPPHNDFLGQTCRLWEESIQPVTAMGIRLVILRTGIVLSSQSGALPSFIRPLHAGIAPILGSGRQVISWIHVEDICRMYMQAMEDAAMQGAYNAVAPAPVSNKTFTLLLAKTLRHKFYIPIYVPAFLLKLILGQMSIEVLKSATVSAGRIRNTGFTFIYPSLESAIGQLTGRR